MADPLQNHKLWVGIKSHKMIYVLESDLAEIIVTSTNAALDDANKLREADILCVQKIATNEQMCIVYCADQAVKAKVLSIHSIQIEGRQYELLDIRSQKVSSFSNSNQNTRISIHGLPFSVTDDEIQSWVDTWAVRVSRVMKAKAKLNPNDRTKHPSLLNGNRFGYANEILRPLPRFTLYQIPDPNDSYNLIDVQLTVFYEGQVVNCRKCFAEDHQARECSSSGRKHNPNMEIFRGTMHPLSNFFQVDLTVDGELFPSSEHLYQFCKAQIMGYPEIATQIQKAKTPLEAKQLGNSLNNSDVDWDRKKVASMLLKNSCSAEFREALETSRDKILVEATSDLFWASSTRPMRQQLNLAMYGLVPIALVNS